MFKKHGAFTSNKKINLYTIFETKLLPLYTDNGFTLRNSLFESVKLTANPGPDKYSYSGYGISFNVPGTFSLPNGGFGEKVIIFGDDMSSSMHEKNNKKKIS